MPITERISVVPEFTPEMASCNMGSINFGLYSLLEKYDEFENEWEREYMEGTRDLIFPNTFQDLETVLPTFDANGTKPELKCYDVSHLYNAKYMIDAGYLEAPVHLQFVMGIYGGIGAHPENLTHMVTIAEKLFGDQFFFSVIGAGKNEFTRAVQSADMVATFVSVSKTTFTLGVENSQRVTHNSSGKPSISYRTPQAGTLRYQRRCTISSN